PRPQPRPEPRAKSRPAPRAEPRAAPPAELDEDTERLRIQVEALQRQCDELRDELAEHEAARRAAESAGEHAQRELEDVRRHLDEATERADRAARAADQAVADRRAMEERLGRARDRAAARPGATSPAIAPASGRPAAASIAPVVPVTTRGDEVDRLVRRLRDARASQAQRLVVLAAPSVAGMERADRRRTLAAVPDGWARQRALQRLVEAGAVPRGEAADLLGMLGSTGSQVFAAGTMVTTGLVGADDLVDVLEPGAVIRLRRRAGGS
ncbi:hypothetical protein KR546_12815, partial [Nitriliruptoria bacterium AS10]